MITLNGEPHAHVARIADLLPPDPRGLAVAVNGEVVPRAEHGRPLAEGDVVEIVTAVQGG